MHLRVAAVQSSAPGRHSVGDVLATLGVISDADVAQVEGLLEVERVLVACCSGCKHSYEVVTVTAFDVFLRLAGEIAGDHIQLAGDHGVHSVVVVGSNRLAVKTFEVNHRNRLVGLSVIVRALPPGSSLRIEEVALHVQVAHAAAISHFCRNHIVICLLHCLESTLSQLIHRHCAGRMAVCTIEDDVALRDAELFFKPLIHSVNDALVGVAVDVCQTSDRLSVGENDGSHVSAVEDAISVAAQLVLGGCYVNLSRSGLELAPLRLGICEQAGTRQYHRDNRQYSFHSSQVICMDSECQPATNSAISIHSVNITNISDIPQPVQQKPALRGQMG